MKRTILYVILAVVIIAAVAGFGFWRTRQAASPEEDIRSATVKRGTMRVDVSASGNIEPEARVDLVFSSPGRVSEVLVEVGDAVATGDVLAQLDAEQLALQVTQAQAALTSAEAQLAQIQAGPRQEEVIAAEANLRAVEAQMNAASASLAQLQSGATDAQIASAEADRASAIIQQIRAEDAHEMTLKCFTFDIPTSTGMKEHTICPALGDPEIQTRYNLSAADSSLAAADAQLDELLAGADINQVRAARANTSAAEAQRDATQAQLDKLLVGATEGQIAAAQARVDQAQVSLELAELALEKTTLHAPFDGVIAAVNVMADEMAAAGPLPAFTLLDTSQFHMTVGVDEVDVGQLAVGQTTQVTLDALSDVILTGRVKRIAPAATIDAGGVVYYDVVIELDPVDVPIRADMTANVTIVVEELANVLMIPTWVVRVGKVGQTYVNQQAGDEVVQTDVALGVRHKGFIQVLDGLSEGDEAIWVQETGFGFRSE
ncbi:MAG: HlyD family efflux transporter periplasmic adaptor subunit [Chloroflexi bacterium]|nr:HlyD family efflux transporter periplasmic adaptor subunit [Chloroflexota bacterium]